MNLKLDQNDKLNYNVISNKEGLKKLEERVETENNKTYQALEKFNQMQKIHDTSMQKFNDDRRVFEKGRDKLRRDIREFEMLCKDIAFECRSEIQLVRDDIRNTELSFN